MNKPPRILIIPARRHVIEGYSEYLIRYLGDEFYFEMGYPAESYREDIKKRVWNGSTSPLEKKPDEFDLLYPHFATHTFLINEEDYAHKIAMVQLEPAQVLKFPSPPAIRALTNYPMQPSYPDAPQLRFGVDTNLFQPFGQVREDNLLHV